MKDIYDLSEEKIIISAEIGISSDIKERELGRKSVIALKKIKSGSRGRWLGRILNENTY